MHVSQRADYTFKYNARLGRHGWLRLTPAYSVKLVKEILHSLPEESFVLDPFSGTATTGVAAAECGISAHGLDINPFLVWIGNVKCRNYSAAELTRLAQDAEQIIKRGETLAGKDNWLPALHNIDRWWDRETLKILAAMRQALADALGAPETGGASALAWVAFCRLIIETSAAAFNHVSMSFHDACRAYDFKHIKALYLSILRAVIDSCRLPLAGGESAVYYADAKNLPATPGARYSHVITSPPYPNRISYIRELRPYMYWTGMLEDAKSASDLDWQAIGGTWGTATSNLQRWRGSGQALPDSLHATVRRIAAADNKNASLMANYVWKYFDDMAQHIQTLRPLLQKGAALFYIVGNSSFYTIPVDTAGLLADILEHAGFANIGIKTIRKRNSKKELFEFCVSATWQAAADRAAPPPAALQPLPLPLFR